MVFDEETKTRDSIEECLQRGEDHLIERRTRKNVKWILGMQKKRNAAVSITRCTHFRLTPLARPRGKMLEIFYLPRMIKFANFEFIFGPKLARRGVQDIIY